MIKENIDWETLSWEEKVACAHIMENPSIREGIKKNARCRELVEQGNFILADATYMFESIAQRRLNQKAQQRTEEEQIWTTTREAELGVKYREIVKEADRQYGIKQTMEMNARPNPFVPPFQNGL